MVYFEKGIKYNIKKKLIHYRDELDSLNTLIEIVIKLNNKFNKLIIKIYYSKANNKTKRYYKYTSHYS